MVLSKTALAVWRRLEEEVGVSSATKAIVSRRLFLGKGRDGSDGHEARALV